MIDDMRQERPYIDASAAAALLGVYRRTVVADVQAGMRGALAALCGAETGGICVVSRWDLEGDRLAMHRARLTADGDREVQP